MLVGAPRRAGATGGGAERRPRRGGRHRAQDPAEPAGRAASASRPSAPSASKSSTSASFDDYVKYLPSVSFQSAGPGFARVFMRGAAAGDNGNHSGPQPGVGQYLDEQPITTIQGALDIHMYDIARVEALAGPQGTLYGASSQSGTIRIITNKPDTSGLRRRLQPRGQHDRRWRPGLPRRRLREHSARRQRRHPPRRLGAPRRRLHRQRGRHAHVPDLGHLDEFAGRGQLQRRRHLRRARRAQDRPQRHLEHHADASWSRSRRANGIYAGESRHRRSRSRALASRRTATTSGRRPRSPSKARSAISTSRSRARISSVTWT